jgi:hypothetical protein
MATNLSPHFLCGPTQRSAALLLYFPEREISLVHWKIHDAIAGSLRFLDRACRDIRGRKTRVTARLPWEIREWCRRKSGNRLRAPT